VRLPDSVTETELLRTIMDASVKEPLAKSNLELRRKLVDEETKAAAMVTQKFEEIKANLAVKYEGEAQDPEQEFDAPDNIKGWQKEDRKLFKDAKTKANKANEKLTARHKSIEEAQNELSAAVAFDRDVVMPPRIKLLPHNEAGYKIGHVMFRVRLAEREASAKGQCKRIERKGTERAYNRVRVQPSACATERVCNRARVQPSACATERVCNRARVQPRRPQGGFGGSPPDNLRAKQPAFAVEGHTFVAPPPTPSPTPPSPRTWGRWPRSSGT
jgi:hypothetical protein